MTLAKKGTRTIEVKGVRYRWLASGGDEGIMVIVELLDNPGQALRALFGYEAIQDSGRGYRQTRSVTPSTVRALIEVGLSRGWKPGEKLAPQFSIENPEQVLPFQN